MGSFANKAFRSTNISRVISPGLVAKNSSYDACNLNSSRCKTCLVVCVQSCDLKCELSMARTLWLLTRFVPHESQLILQYAGKGGLRKGGVAVDCGESKQDKGMEKELGVQEERGIWDGARKVQMGPAMHCTFLFLLCLAKERRVEGTKRGRRDTSSG